MVTMTVQIPMTSLLLLLFVEKSTMHARSMQKDKRFHVKTPQEMQHFFDNL